MAPTLPKCPVFALITSVLVSLGLFCGVQPTSRLPCGPDRGAVRSAPAELQDPSLVPGSKAPRIAEAAVRVAGSITSKPPWQVMAPISCP